MEVSRNGAFISCS